MAEEPEEHLDPEAEALDADDAAPEEDAWRRFARPAGSIGLICLLGAGAAYLLRGEFNGIVAALLVLSLAFLLLWGFGDPASALALFGARQTRYGSNAVVMAVAVIGVIALVNFLVARHSPQWDLTANQANTLSPLSVKILRNLPQAITITAYMSDEYFGKKQFQQLMNQVTAITNKVSVTYVDPFAEPARAAQANIRQDGTAVLQMGSKRQDLTVTDEQSLISAINKLENEQQKKVYFLVGHGERNTDGFNATDYSQFKTDLQNATFLVDTLNLASVAQVPADAAVVIIASPNRPIPDNERAALDQYMQAGGKAMVLSEPYSKSNLNDLVSKYDVSFYKGLVLDTAQGGNLQGRPEIPLVARFTLGGAITQGLANVVFPGTTGIEIKQSGKGTNVQPLAQTSGANTSWIHQSDNLDDLRFKEGDVRGPITLAATAEQSAAQPGAQATPTATASATPEPTATPVPGTLARKVRLVVIGTADVASNRAIANPGNHDFVLNCVKWLAEEENLVGIGPKSTTDRSVVLSNAAQRLIFLSTVVISPLVVLGVGATVWWRRR